MPSLVEAAGAEVPAATRRRKVAWITQYNIFPPAERLANIRANLATGTPNLHPLIGCETGQSMVIVGGGPSATDELPTIKSLIAQGARLIVIDRMYPWAMQHGLLPDYMVIMDANPDTLEGLSWLHPGTTHLVALQCHPSILTRLKDSRAYLFQTPQRGLSCQAEWEQAGYDQMTEVNSGGSVTLCAMSLALLLGCPRLHVFGFDCCARSDTDRYAAGIAGQGTTEVLHDFEIEGEHFLTTTAYLSFAQQFFILMAMAAQHSCWEAVTVYGRSLVAALGKLGQRTDDNYCLTRSDLEREGVST